MATEWSVTPWWERGTYNVPTPCRDYAPMQEGCSEVTTAFTECSTEVDPSTGDPVKRCVRLYKRYQKCKGGAEKVDEQKEEIMARGEGAQELEPNLAELPNGRLQGAAAGPSGVAAAAPDVEGVGHAVQEFLRFAEELQEQMVPGTMHLDQMPPAPARPYSEADAQQQQQQQAGKEEQQHFSWLGSLLFGKRRGEQQGSNGRHQQANPSMWREFERDFTEV